MKEKANYPNNTKNKKNKIDHFLAFRRKAKMYAILLILLQNAAINEE